jgi:hypothetical protein
MFNPSISGGTDRANHHSSNQPIDEKEGLDRMLRTTPKR